MKSSDALDSREKTIAILGDRWWQRTAKQDGDEICEGGLCSVWKVMSCRRNIMSAGMLEVSLLGVGTVLRLEQWLWSFSLSGVVFSCVYCFLPITGLWVQLRHYPTR
ncbi:unnamed protein product [Sphacelaria rigidula]